MVVDTDLTVTSGQSIDQPIVLEGGADLDNEGTIGGDVDTAIYAKASSSDIENRGAGSIRGARTAIYLEHGGLVYNAQGATIEAMEAGGGHCSADGPCAIYSGSDPAASSTDVQFTLANQGQIIGNVQADVATPSLVQLFSGSSIHGDLDIRSLDSILRLEGSATTAQRYSGAVTGATTFSGALLKYGSSTWIIDTDDLTPTMVSVDEGTLQIGDGGTTGSLGDVGSVRLGGGNLVFNRSDDVIFGGRILAYDADRPDSLVQAGTGTLILTADYIWPSSIVIERGTLQFGNTGGTSGDTERMNLGEIENNGALVFDSRSDINVMAISGSGSVTQNGSAPLILTGVNTYTGGTVVNRGVLLAQSALPGNVVINPGGSLGGASVTEGYTGVHGINGDVSNSGTVVAALGDTVVGGNYVQTATGTLAASLGNKVDVAGTATLDGTLEANAPTGFYMADTHTEVLTAAGGVTGTFSQLVKGTGVVFTSTTINYDANSVWLDTTGLDITIAAAGDGIGYTPVSMSAAVRTQGAFEQLNRKIETHSLAGVSNAFLQSAGQFQQAASIEAAQASLRSLSGQLHAASAAMTFRAIDAGNQALSDHLDNLRDGNAAYGMWTQQLGSGGGMARNGFDGVGFQLNGWLVGNDYRLGRNGVLGFAFGQGHGVQQLQAGADRDASRRTEGMVYAGLTSDRWYAQGRLGFGQFRQDVNRQLLLGNAAEGVWTRYGGRYQVAYGESGLRWNRGNVRIAPFVSMEYARSDRDAFAEEGAGGFGLRSDAQSQARWQAAVGLRAARQWNFGGGRSLDVGAHAQWFRTLGMDGEAMDASFVGLQQWSPLLGIGLSRHGSLAGVGLDARLSPRAMFKLGYDYERGQYDSAHGMTAALNVAF
jgi:fibronectin-binding autotransporter adhesin